MESKKFLIFRIIIITISIILLISIEYYQNEQIEKEEKLVEQQSVITEEKILDMTKLYIINDQDYFNDIVKEKNFEYRINTDELVKEKLLDNNQKFKGYIKILNDEFTYVKCENMLYDNLNSRDYVTNSNNEKAAYDLKSIYKGDNPNNYIRYKDKLYRIIGITNSNYLKVISMETSKEDVWGLSGNINFLKTDKNAKNNINGIFYVGYVRSETNKIDQIMKNERRNNTYTVVAPKLYADYSYINVSDIINASSECKYTKITDINKDNCKSYLFNILNNTYTSNAAENNMVYKINENGEIIISKLEKNIDIKKVTYISLFNKYKSGDGSKDKPYVIEEQ